MIFDGMLSCRGVPTLNVLSKEDFLNRKPYIKEIIQKNEYGFIPENPEHLSVSVSEEDLSFAAGKAKAQTIENCLKCCFFVK